MSGFLDTSVLLRYLVRDDAARAEQAARLIDGETVLLASSLVLHEAAHVLRSVYQVPREQIVDSLLAFVQRQNVVIVGMDKDLVQQGLLLCRPSGRVSFVDALLWAQAQSGGPRVVYSFDQRFPTAGIEVRDTWS